MVVDNLVMGKYFNSRPSARGDVTKDNVIGVICISIHAPPRGATILCVNRKSIRKFQFTPLREGRLFRLQRDYHGALISIHAPPRGATHARGLFGFLRLFQFTPLREGRLREEMCWHTKTKFQFTPLREGRRKGRAHGNIGVTFQFTPLREGRRALMVCMILPRDFNSRPSARGDGTRRTSPGTADISIHAPPRGATANYARKMARF